MHTTFTELIVRCRNGTCSIFLFTEPLAGWRYTEAKEHRTMIDWAERIKWLLDEQYPDAEQVILVCDNLNTHEIASLYEAFPPDEALRLAKRLEIHHTPKRITALDITEIELSALGNQCLSKRHISNVKELMRSYQLGTPILMPHREVSIGSSRQPRHESS